MTDIEEKVRGDQDTDLESRLEEQAPDPDEVQIEEDFDTKRVEDGLVDGRTPVQLAQERQRTGERVTPGNVSLIDEQGTLEGGGELQLTGLFAEVNPIADEPDPEFVGKRSTYIHDEPGVSPSKLQAKDTPDGMKTEDGNTDYDDLDFDKLDEERQTRIRSSRNTASGLTGADSLQPPDIDEDEYEEKRNEDGTIQGRSDVPKKDVFEEGQEESFTGPTSAKGTTPREVRAGSMEEDEDGNVTFVEDSGALGDIQDRQIAQHEAVEEGGAPEEARLSPTDTEHDERPVKDIEDYERDTSTVEGYDVDARRAELKDMTKAELHKQYGVSEGQSKDEMIDEVITNESA